MKKLYGIGLMSGDAFARANAQQNMSAVPAVYLASEVDARIAELEKALRVIIRDHEESVDGTVKLGSIENAKLVL